MFRRLFSIVGLLLALAGCGMFIAIGIQVWYVKAEVNRQTNELAQRANAAGDSADRAINFVGDVIGTAKGELANTRNQTNLPEPERVNPFVRMAARQAAVDLTGSVDRTLGAVVTASNTVGVAEAALEMLSSDQRLEKVFGVHPDQLHQTQNTLASVSGELRKARSILGIPIGTGGDLPSNEQLNAVEEALHMADNFRVEMTRIVGMARTRVNETKRLIDMWAFRLTLAVTIVSVIGAVGQFFFARYCLRRLHDLPA